MKLRNGNVDKILGGNTNAFNFHQKPSGEFLLKSATKCVNCEQIRKHQELEISVLQFGEFVSLVLGLAKISADY